MGVNIGHCTCREFHGVHSWQNGTKCRDDVKVLQCRSHLHGCFVFSRIGKEEKREVGGEAKGKMHRL